jgi:hypothetical protein
LILQVEVKLLIVLDTLKRIALRRRLTLIL